MKKIAKFVADDGFEFDNVVDCLKYELLIRRVNDIMSFLPKLPDDTDFFNGHGYIQHDKITINVVKINLLTLIKEYTSIYYIQEAINGKEIHASWISRVLGDLGLRPLIDAWHRIACVDSNLREWGQLYYANNPEQAIGKFCINDDTIQ